MSVLRFFQRNVSGLFNTSSNTNGDDNQQAENPNDIELNIDKINDKLVSIEVPTGKLSFESLYANNVTDLNIDNCYSSSKALEHFESSAFEKVLKDTKTVTFIKYKVANFDNGLTTTDLQRMSSKCINKSAVILFCSEDNANFSIYWKSKVIESFLVLKPYCSSTLKAEKIFFEFVAKFLTNALSHDHLGLCNQYSNKRDSTEFELHLLADNREFNVLLAAAYMGDADVVAILLKLGIQTESPFKDVNAQSLAYSGRHFDVLFLLLQSNLKYPPQMDLNNCSIEIQNFIKICFDIHHYIEVGDKDMVTEIINVNSNIRHFYNELNESAAAFALRAKQLEIYEILMMREVHFGPHENTEEIMEGLDYDSQRAVRELHNKHAKDLPESHINLLMANSFVGHDVDNVHEKLSLVQHTFNILNSYELIRIILMVVAASKKFRIIFDFNRDNVHVADPTSPANTTGIFYVSGRIYIGARQLLNKMTENETFGTLAHELCHYALNLTYGNDANPYSSTDNKYMQEFEEISTVCEQKKGKEEVVDLVYSHYPPDMYHAELAVRVPHLYGLYHGQPEKLMESKENLKELFEFIESKVGPDMKEAIARIEDKVDREIELKDKKITKLRRNFVISIVFGVIIAFVIAIIVGVLFYNPTYVFNQLSNNNQRKVENSMVKYKNITLKLNDLYPMGSMAYDRLTSNHISQLLSGNVLDIDDPQLHYLDDLIDFRWEHLASNLKKKTFESNLNFQGKNVQFKEINELIPKSIEKLSSQQIIQILNSETLVVSKKLESSVDFYIDRKFIPEDTKLLDFEYKYGHDYIHNYLILEEHKKNRTMNTTFEQFATKFSQQSFDSQTKILDQVLSNIYYKSTLIDAIKDDYKFSHKTTNQLIEKSEKDKIVILSSEAGAGKTVTFQQLAIQIKNLYPTRWVSYIDMKDYTKFYKRGEFGGKGENIEFGGKEENVDFGGKGENVEFGGKGENVEFGGKGENVEFGGNIRIIENSTKTLKYIKNGKSIEINNENSDVWVSNNTKNVRSITNIKHALHINYDENITSTRNDENVLNILENILDLSSSKNEFEREVFHESFKIGNVVLLWNGFDEISPTYNQFIIHLIEFIHKNTKNIQFVCTRPLYSKQLRDTFRMRTWELIPFTKVERHEFLRKFFSFQNVSESGIEDYIQKVNQVVYTFESNDKISYNFSTPMMLKLVGEIYENRNSSEAPGLYEIYETFVQKKIIIWLTRSKLEYKVLGKFISKFSVMEIYLKYAMLTELRIFATSTFGLKMKKLQIMQKTIPDDLPFEEISRMGILYINGEKKFEFAHRTFAEFFIAKFFIDNVYLADNYVDDNEAELRLELFFMYARNYGDSQTLITEFMNSFFQIKSKNPAKSFSIKIANLLNLKFRNFFIRLIDTNHPKIFEFLFKFFSKDHKILVNLLKIGEGETFYTAIYNPNRMGLFTDPKEIKKLAHNYLSETEVELFTSGRNQKGIILFGMNFYNLLNISKKHDAYDSEVNSYSYWNFFYKSRINLTIDEQKELAIAALSPKIYIFYDKLFNTSNATSEYTNPDYEQLWEIFESILSPKDIESILEHGFNHYYELFAYGKPENGFYLQFLAIKLESILSDFQILHFYLRTNILQKAHWDPSDFENLWAILSDHTTVDERKKVLLIDYTDDRNFFFYFALDDLKKRFSGKMYVYMYYDFTPFKIIQRSLTTPYALTFDFLKEVYHEYFTKLEIQQIIMSSNDLIYYVIEQALEENCVKFASYLREIFEDNKQVLKIYLERYIRPTSLSIFPYVEGFQELPASVDRWFRNLKTIQLLYDEVKDL